MPRARRLATPLLALALCALAACGKKPGDKAAPTGPERPPLVRFEGYVYVEARATDFQILERVRQQVATVFPGLRRSRVMVSRREVPRASTRAFRMEVVVVVDAARDERRSALRIRYRFVTRADHARGMDALDGGRLEVPLAALMRTRDIDVAQVVRACTARDPRERLSQSSLAIDFDPTLERCKAAIQAEQAAIDAARAKLAGGAPDAGSDAGSAEEMPVEEIPIEEAERLYVPIAVALEPPPPGPLSRDLPRYEPFDPLPPEAEAEAEAPSPEERIKPAEVIVDPDLPQPKAEPATGAAPAAAAGAPAGAPVAAHDPAKDGPRVVAPPAPPARPAGPPKAEVEVTLADRVVEALEQIFQLKFIAVWLSLLLVIPILLGKDRRRKSQTP